MTRARAFDEQSRRDLQASDTERAFETQWRLLSPPSAPQPVTQYRFLADRKFLFDVAWPDYKVGVELQGGTYSGGAHVHGQHYRQDCEKLNLAQLQGWILLWFPSDWLRDDPQTVVNMIIDAIKINTI